MGLLCYEDKVRGGIRKKGVGEGSKSITGARHLHTRCNYRRSVALALLFFFSPSRR